MSLFVKIATDIETYSSTITTLKKIETSANDTTISKSEDVSTSFASIISSFNLVISTENWQKIKPVKKTYKNRIYWVLQTGWTDIAEKLWQKLDCTFVFKKHKVHLSAKARYYVVLQGAST